MKQRMSLRINALHRATIFCTVLAAILVFVDAWLPPSQAMPATTSTSPVHIVDNASATPVAPSAVELSAYIDIDIDSASLATLEVPPAAVAKIDYANRIGILAGHWGFDTGAVCNDGLLEVDITKDVAERVATQLRALGYDVEILKEHMPGSPQPPLQGYLAAAFLALHVDSCFPGASGYKISRWAYSNIPEIEDRLVQCLYDEYGAATSLPRHDDSITINMWNYYAFREIAEPTPGAIIEMGFMADDRAILVEQPDRVAVGIVNGLLCFLKDSTN